MKEIIFYNSKYQPYILRYNFKYSISGARLKQYLRAVYNISEKKILLLNMGRLIRSRDHISYDIEIAWCQC